jgi:tRNA pseudouridine55 synthase
MSKYFNRPVNGLLVLDKPSGISSNQALQQARKLFRAQKAGHTGSLDPLATGVLPLCFGESTKFSQYLLESDKVYLVTAQLGVSTDSGDSDGRVISEQPVPRWADEDIEPALAPFRGEIEQVPSMFSALKYQGTPLYKLARAGKTVERKARTVTIHKLALLDWAHPNLTLEVSATKGTYMRTLIEDLGVALGVGGHITGLRRVQAGPYSLQQAVTLEQLAAVAQESGFEGIEKLLQPISSAVHSWPRALLSFESAQKIMHGQSVAALEAPKTGWVQILRDPTSFLGVGEVLPDGRIAPRRLVREA